MLPQPNQIIIPLSPPAVLCAPPTSEQRRSRQETERKGDALCSHSEATSLRSTHVRPDSPVGEISDDCTDDPALLLNPACRYDDRAEHGLLRPLHHIAALGAAATTHPRKHQQDSSRAVFLQRARLQHVDFFFMATPRRLQRAVAKQPHQSVLRLWGRGEDDLEAPRRASQGQTG